MTPKISIIGAGSARFSLSLIQDLCLTPNLTGSTVSFMDVDHGRLDAAYTICQRYADEVGADLNLEYTTNRRESLQSADFVINTALVAGHQMMMDGIQIASDLGYRYGGSYHIMHDEPFWVNYYQFKFFDELTDDMLDICPDAWPWWYHVDDDTEALWKEDVAGYRQRVFEKMKSTANWSQDLAVDPSVRLIDEFPPEKSGWDMIPIIESMAYDIPRTFIVNLGNSGSFVNGIPKDFEVEVLALISKSGVRGIQTRKLPAELIAYALRDRVAPVNIELSAYEWGSQELLLQLILMDPWTRSVQQAQDLLDAVLSMPGNDDMQAHFS